jgi:hypothetical protein
MGFFDILGGIAKEVINNSVRGSASQKDAYLNQYVKWIIVSKCFKKNR